MPNSTQPYKTAVLSAFYESGPYIEARLASYEQQTAIDSAHFVLLNCQNKHNERQACLEFCDRHPNSIYVEYKSHKWLYSTWNDGIELTSTEYICSANADDLWHPDYLAECVGYLDNHPDIGFVSTNVLVTSKHSQRWPGWEYESDIRILWPGGTVGPSPMWRRTNHTTGMFGNYSVIGDARIWETWDAAGIKWGKIDKDLVLYYLNPVSLERKVDENGTSYRDIDLANG